MKYLIVDDEMLARQRVKRLMGLYPYIECVAQAENAQEAYTLALEYEPDLILLDINMPGENGLELAAKLSTQLPKAKIVFVTAHSEFALEAFNVFAAGYLVKPISADDLDVIITRLFPAHIQYSLGHKTRWVALEDVYMAKAEDKCTQLYFKGGEASIDISLKKLLASYPTHFIQVHRNTLVKKSRIESLNQTSSGNFLMLTDCDEQVAVSRRALSLVKQALSN